MAAEPASYNRVVKFGSILLLALSLTACHHGLQTKESVRQGVIDYLSSRKDLSIGGMDIDVTSVTFNGDKAEAAVSFAPKGGNASAGMTMRYELQQQNNKWVVTGRQDSGQNPHGGLPAAGGANPHGGAVPGGAVPGADAGGKMPSPNDLPPTKKQ